MMQLTNLDKLLNTLGVEDCSNPQPVDVTLIDLVKKELDLWVKQQMGDNPYIFSLITPSSTGLPNNISGVEVEMFSFGVFSRNLWDFLVSNKDNPVFRLLKYFSDNIEYLNLLKSKYEVDKLTPDIPINDRFGLEFYNFIYRSVKEVI